MQYEITEPMPLLDENGELAARGWARQPLLKYSRFDVKAPKRRIKEWDYYLPISLTSLLVLPDTPKSHNPFTHISPSFHPL